MKISSRGIIIEKVFNAPRKLLWNAWTKPEYVKMWWGPKDFYSPSIKIDFRVGGKYIYCMHGPKGSEWDKDLYSSGIFKEIVPYGKIVLTDYFSDDQGNKTSPTEHGLVSDMPAEMSLTIHFVEISKNKTKVIIEYPRPLSNDAFKTMKESGMEEGWGTSLDKLEKVVLKQIN